MFFANGKLSKQTDGFTMGRPISVVFSDILESKMEFDVVVPPNPLFINAMFDDTYMCVGREKISETCFLKILILINKILN